MLNLFVSILLSTFVVLLLAFISLLFQKENLNDYGYGNDIEEEKIVEPDEKEKAGIKGENKAYAYLSTLLQDNEFIFKNVLIPAGNGKMSELDCVLVTRKGLFCIEVKNWSGTIKGGNTDEIWRQDFSKYKRPQKEHQNPVIQNHKHCDTLIKLLKFKYSVFNIVIFLSQSNLRYVQSRNSFTLNKFKEGYNHLPQNTLTRSQINEIASVLKPFEAGANELDEFREQKKRICSLHEQL